MIYSIGEIKRRITPVASKRNVNAIYLFGSYAKNEANDNSDIDMLVDGADSIISFLDVAGLYGDLEDALGKNIDVVMLDDLEEHGDSNPRLTRFKKRIMKERVPVYVRN